MSHAEKSCLCSFVKQDARGREGINRYPAVNEPLFFFVRQSIRIMYKRTLGLALSEPGDAYRNIVSIWWHFCVLFDALPPFNSIETQIVSFSHAFYKLRFHESFYFSAYSSLSSSEFKADSHQAHWYLRRYYTIQARLLSLSSDEWHWRWKIGTLPFWST